jgi:leucyl/phenylalanyl-tRNA--protein transferase
MKRLSLELTFPSLSEATPDGLLAMGGDLSVERLMLAYTNGIFPWFESDEPLLWWAPDPRFVLFPQKLKISKSTQNLLKTQRFEITYNCCFDQVILACASIKRTGQRGTWISKSMIDACCKLNDLGYAKSVEVWQNSTLVGGLYGVDLGNGVFCGESMFSKVSNASKLGFVNLVQSGKYFLIDCQVHTTYLEQFGAEYISRDHFMTLIKSKKLSKHK